MYRVLVFVALSFTLACGHLETTSLKGDTGIPEGEDFAMYTLEFNPDMDEKACLERVKKSYPDVTFIKRFPIPGGADIVYGARLQELQANAIRRKFTKCVSKISKDTTQPDSSGDQD